MADEFDIYSKLNEYLKDIGQSPEDCGGTVTFTGADPIVRSHFRIGSCMAIPAMAVGVGAATIWKERTGEGQDLKVDVRESLYNVNPFMMPLLKADKAAGRAAPDDPIPDSFKFVPSINGRFYQAPLLIGHPHVRPQTAVAN